MYNIDDIVNTVIHGDSHIELKKIPSESIDCIIIDPPYRYLKHKLDRPFDEALIFNELYRVLKPNSFLVIFGIGARLCRDIVMLEDIGFKCKEECIWVKNNITNFMCNLPRKHESFYILSKGNKQINKCYVDYFESCVNENRLDKLYNTYINIINSLKNKEKIKDIENKIYNGVNNFCVDRDVRGIIRCHSLKRNLSYIDNINKLINGVKESSVIYCNKNSVDNEHGTQKPLELMIRIIKLVSNENDIILDCFAGSGSTLLGAIKNDRRYIGIEIDDEYYNVCINRIKEKQGLFYEGV